MLTLWTRFRRFVALEPEHEFVKTKDAGGLLLSAALVLWLLILAGMFFGFYWVSPR